MQKFLEFVETIAADLLLTFERNVVKNYLCAELRSAEKLSSISPFVSDVALRFDERNFSFDDEVY
jgi:hypothetical protein